MANRSSRPGCCAVTDPAGCPADLAAKAELGHRRLTRLRQLVAVASALLCAVAVLVYVGLLPAEPQVSERLALAAALCGGPKLFGRLRQLLITRRLTAPAVAWLGLAVALLAGLALPVAVAVATVLVGDLVLQARRDRSTVAPVRKTAELIPAQ